MVSRSKLRVQVGGQQNVFFCSDPHYHHKSLILGTSNWADKSGCRDFDNLLLHDDTLVDNINNFIGEEDTLFCLGDWSFGNYKNGDNVSKILEFRYRINCKNIHLILGNHDDEIRKDINNVRQIFTSVSDYKEVEIIETSSEQGVKAIKTLLCLMHYPIRSWRNMRKGSVMLHGHCHGTLPDLVIGGKKVKTMDVGFDTHEEFRPYSWQEIKDIMEDRSIITEDHH